MKSPTPARFHHCEYLVRQRVWALRRTATRPARAAWTGAELVLSVDGELRRARLYRAHEQAEVSHAIAETQATIEAKGWA